MRKTLVSLSLIASVGSTLVAGGAFSVFNDTSTATGSFVTGSVKLDLGTNTLQLSGDCKPVYVDAAHADATANMGSVNNNVCTSTIPVTNKGTLPMILMTAGSSVTDAISTVTAGGVVASAANGLPCFVSQFVADDLNKIVAPGATRSLRVTTTVNPDNVCQNLKDAVTATVLVNESVPAAA